MADAEARFVINCDVSGAQAAGNALGSNLEQLKKRITDGSRALQEMQAAAERLRSSADVLRFEEAGKGLRRAQTDADKLQAKIGALREKLAGATDIKTGRGLVAQIQDAQGWFESAQGKVASLSAQREKLGQSEAVKAYKDVTGAIREKQGALAESQLALSRMGGTLSETTGSLTEAAAESKGLGGSLEQMAGGLSRMGGPLGEAGAGLEGIIGKVKSLAALGPAALVLALAAAVVITGAAVAKATYELVTFLTKLGDAARTARIFVDATARSEAGGNALAASINAVYQRVGGARAEIQQMALDLRRLGIQGAALEYSLEAITATSRVFGQEAGSAIQGLIDKAQRTRVGVLQPIELLKTGLDFADVAHALAANMKISIGAAGAALRNGQVKVEDFTRALRDATRARTGDALQKLALSLPEQFARARDNIEQIFKVDPSKILGGLNSILSLLDETTETGKTLRELTRAVFQPLMDFVGSNVFPIHRGMFMGMVLVAMDLAIALIEVAIVLKSMIPESFGKEWDLVTMGFYLGAALAGTLIGVFVGLAGILAIVAVSALIAAAPFLLLAAVVAAAIYVFFELVDYAENMAENFYEVGGLIVDGLVEGITSRASRFFKALGDLATGGLDFFNTKAEIQSPSRLFARSGEQISAGVAEGVEDGAPRVSGAVARLADPTALDAAAGSARGGSATPSTVNLTVKIDARGSSAAEGQRQAGIVTQLIEVLDDALRQAGGTPVKLAGVEVTT